MTEAGGGFRATTRQRSPLSSLRLRLRGLDQFAGEHLAQCINDLKVA